MTLPLSRILTILVCLMLLITATAVSLPVSKKVSHALASLEEGDRSHTATNVAHRIDAFLDDNLRVLMSHARNPQLVQAVLDPDGQRANAADQLDTMTMIGRIVPLELRDFEGEIIHATNPRVTPDQSPKWNDALLSGERPHHVGVHVTTTDSGMQQWVIGVPVQYGGTTEGTLCARIPIDDSLRSLVDLSLFEKHRLDVVFNGNVIAGIGSPISTEGTSNQLQMVDATIINRFGRLRASSMHRSLLSQITLIFVIVTILSGIFWIVIARRAICAPLRQLERMATRVSKGEPLRQNPKPVMIEELSSLQESIGQMATAVQEREQSMMKLQRELEQRVEERTRELETARIAAENASRAKSEFLANMSHEIRTPMTAILGFTDVLIESAIGLNEGEVIRTEQHDAAMTIKRNGEYLVNIINDILDLSKIEAGKMGVERISISPVDLIREVMHLMVVRSEGKGLSFNCEVVGSIPANIESDPTRLRQILINVIGNAIKFTENGGVRVIIRCIPAEGDGNPTLQFDVIDTGIGMTEEHAERIFKPFSQADESTTRQFGGTGLGLNISSRFANMLGGSLRLLSSTPNEGSAFRIEIDAGKTSGEVSRFDPLGDLPKLNAARLNEAIEERPLKDVRILLAEDGPDNQRLIDFVLRKAGASVTIVGDGQALVDTIVALGDYDPGYDVILTDVQMPVMGGYEATAKLRQLGYSGCIIALTAHAMDGQRQRCIESGCNDFATKPIDRDLLIGIIAQHVHSDRKAA